MKSILIAIFLTTLIITPIGYGVGHLVGDNDLNSIWYWGFLVGMGTLSGALAALVFDWLRRKKMNKYTFVNPNNGHKDTYHAFETNAELTQDKVEQIIFKNYPFAKRSGCDFCEFLNALVSNGYIARVLPDSHIAIGNYLRGISGNY